MTYRCVVRPNRYDSRERRLEDDLRSLIKHIRERHPEDFDNNTLINLGVQTDVRKGEKELEQPRHSDLDGRVRSPLVRWWRDVRTRNMD